MFGKKIIVFDGSHYLKGQAAARTYYGLLIVRSQNQHSSHQSPVTRQSTYYIDKVFTWYKTTSLNSSHRHFLMERERDLESKSEVSLSTSSSLALSLQKHQLV